MRPVDKWLAEYARDHENPANQALHSICVPLIVWSLLGLAWSIPLPAWVTSRAPEFNLSMLLVAGVLLYYMSLSAPLALGAMVCATIMLVVCDVLEAFGAPLWRVAIGVFVIAWVGQFLGHYFEGRRPSFLQDLRFLLIGPLWVLAKLYRRLGIAV